jgi:DNA-directed RNA polymerase subunit beta'
VQFLETAYREIAEVEKQYRAGSITDGERYNKIIDIWTHTTDNVADALFRGLEHNQGEGAINPVFIMVDSGARGSRQQIRQLAGMRGLMAKPSGEIIETPIISNFREGLTVLEYFISTHGARKGLADTALKTADSGYLTRRLVDVSQDVIIEEEDCKTLNGITIRPVYEGEDEVVTLRDRILGRVALEDVHDPISSEIICKRGEQIDEQKSEKIEHVGLTHVKIRSVLTCESVNGVCVQCYGRNLANCQLASLGEAVGIIAAQSIGEPGTQLTMRTFHIGGTASQIFKQPQIIAKNDGVLKFHDIRAVEAKDKTLIVLNKNGIVSIHNEEGRELEKYTILVGAVIGVPENSKVKKGQAFVKWDPYNIPILAGKSGTVEFHDMIEGVTMKKEIDETTGLVGRVIIEHKEELHPQIVLYDDNKEVQGYYSIPAGAHIVAEEGQKAGAGSVLAKTPRKTSRTKDITGGLPRVAELFEARRPKEAAEIAKIDGIVEFGGSIKGKRRLIVRDTETGTAEEHLISHGKHLTVYKGDHVKKGQQLTEGPVVPQEILQVCGPRELQEYMVNQVQEVYRLQGVEINDKHIEVIVRQMLRKVRIVDPGNTSFIYDEQVSKRSFLEENERVVARKGKPAEAAPLLLGITKASLGTESFISAASFQETTRILTDAASNGKTDVLKGFKENVIMGHVIPAGTGFLQNRQVTIARDEVEVPSKKGKQDAKETKAADKLVAAEKK